MLINWSSSYQPHSQAIPGPFPGHSQAIPRPFPDHSGPFPLPALIACSKISILQANQKLAVGLAQEQGYLAILAGYIKLPMVIKCM